MMSKRTQILIAGSALGAVLGLLAGVLVAGSLDKRRTSGLESSNIVSVRTTVDWVKFVVAAVLLVRQFAGLLSPDTK